MAGSELELERGGKVVARGQSRQPAWLLGQRQPSTSMEKYDNIMD